MSDPAFRDWQQRLNNPKYKRSFWDYATLEDVQNSRGGEAFLFVVVMLVAGLGIWHAEGKITELEKRVQTLEARHGN